MIEYQKTNNLIDITLIINGMRIELPLMDEFQFMALKLAINQADKNDQQETT